jgi:formyl-CoA transferase
LCQAVGRADLSKNPRFSSVAQRQQNGSELVALLDACFAGKDLAQWTKIFDDHQLAWSQVPTTAEVVHDPQLAANDVLVPFDHPDFDQLRTVNSPMFLADEPKTRPQPPPALGQHTREVLGALSYDPTMIERLAALGVIQI